ncbi:MAG: anhydro-N-acetylmuramic acid kinase [Phaeodactylibacter sp.]|uniref:anhydro-N-acetylmuramic acid kinase n=1 Tax=Phaeodactylibacter sp. TaxID=1940289 RepID=UPI0032ECCCEC
MSGSSLDGLDLALCTFGFTGSTLHHWEVVECAACPFPEVWTERLRQLPDGSAKDLAIAHAQFGRFLGEQARAFLDTQEPAAEAVASHGHTIFHFPEAGVSTQIGDGAVIAAITGLPCIDNFRMQDVALGGQGAPIAPIADQYLFPEQTFMLNLGGIANISARTAQGYIAFDCSGANQVLNALAKEAGQPYDNGGAMARVGRLLPALLEKALSLPYHSAPYPKSLGNDWVQEQLLPIYTSFPGSVEDRLHTACRQIAQSIDESISAIGQHANLPAPPHSMLITGGGAFNTFLVECIRAKCEKNRSLAVRVPQPQIIEYKEAILMALMGAMRLEGLPNTLPTATGAMAGSCGGGLHTPPLNG